MHFAEPPVDICYQEDFPRAEGARVFSVEFLPGQFDQRADSAVQCVQFLKEDEQPIIRSAVTYVIEGEMTDEQFDAVKAHCINPVDSRETGLEKPETLVTKFEEPADVKIFDGFIDMPEAELKALYDSLGLAMTFKDFLHIQNYFRGEEKRNPSMTEIRVLDTYWSDHCRHTTFSTELTNVTFGEGDYYEPMKKSYDRYLSDREVLYKGRDDKFICLMDLALLAMKKLKSEGKLADQEESDEINACSIVVPVDVDGKDEEWLINFKNEVALAGEGYDVTAVELVKYNLGILKSKKSSVKAFQGNALNLSRFADSSFDITLLFGPMYHLYTFEDKHQALEEAKRVTRPGGRILVAYCMNEYGVLLYGFRDGNVKQCLEDGRLSKEFKCVPHPEDLYDYMRLEDIDALNAASGLERYKIISPDGPANYMRPVLNAMDDQAQGQGWQLSPAPHQGSC